MNNVLKPDLEDSKSSIFLRRAKRNGQSLSSLVIEQGSGSDKTDYHWVKAAKKLTGKGDKPTKSLPEGQYLKGLDDHLVGVDGSSLSRPQRARLAAVMSSATLMNSMKAEGKLSPEVERAGVSRAAASAFDVLGRTADAKKSQGLFNLAATASDAITRDSLKKSFSRGLVSDVANSKGQPWNMAAKGLASLGMISPKDPRLGVSSKAIGKAASRPEKDFDTSEVDSGTAATSVMQLGRSMDDATASIGKRLNAGAKSLTQQGKILSGHQKMENHQERAALNEATGLASLKAGGRKKDALNLFAIAGANSQKSAEYIRMPMAREFIKKKKKGQDQR